MSDDESSEVSGKGNAELDALIRQFAARIDRLERELKELRKQLESTRSTPRAAGGGTA